jgi:hypothetical protein
LKELLLVEDDTINLKWISDGQSVRSSGWNWLRIEDYRFWDVTPNTLVGRYQLVGETH